jgi:FAD/FMN-containing dehydrogenase
MTTNWSNWSGLVTCHPATIAAPADETDVAMLVRRSSAAGKRVRIVGSGHSFTPICATDDTLISLDNLAGVESADRRTYEAWVRAGTKIHDLGDPLWDAGLSLPNQGDVDVQSIAGAVSTGTHGTGETLGNISTQVIGMRLATAEGEILTIDGPSDAELLRAARVSLGTLGVVTALRMRLRPAYYLCELQKRVPIEECLAELAQQIRSNRHFEFFWYSATDLAHTKALNPTTETATSDLPEGTRIDRSYRIFPTVRTNRFNEMEYAIPAENGPACFAELRNLMRSRHPNVAWPVEYRTLAADDAMLSAAYGRETVTLSIHQGADLPYQAFFADAESIFRNYQGRPHWAKLHNLGAAELRSLWPRWNDFQQIRRQLDPGRTFLNDYLERLFSDA